VEKSLKDNALPLKDFSTVSTARQFPQLSVGRSIAMTWI
jgi:hypothetical protein